MRKRWWVAVLLMVIIGMIAFKMKGQGKVESGRPGEGNSEKAPAETASTSHVVQSTHEEEVEKERKKPTPRPEIKKRPKDEGPPVAKSVPGKQGYVFSPISGNIVDVRDIPPGTLVQDPSADPSVKAIFRLPPDENSAEGAEGK